MPTIARISELISTALNGLPVTIELISEGGRPSVRVHIDPDSLSADEASPTAGSGPADSGFSLVAPTSATSTGTAAEAWWTVITPATPGPHVLSLHSQLRGSGESSTIDRIRLAYGRGRQGAAIYRGEATHFTGDRASLRNRCYVVLRARHHTSPFFTWNLTTHQTAVRPPPGDFDHQAISHGLASQAEARAFCLGAGLPDLPEQLQ